MILIEIVIKKFILPSLNMNNKLIQLIMLLLVLNAFSGCSNHTENQLKDSSELNVNIDSKSNNTNEPLPDESETAANWSNPFLNPFGQNVVNYIRAFYLSGQFELISNFLIGHEKLSAQEFNAVINGAKWGYQLTATNMKWSSDSTFVITCKTIKNNTEGMEEYCGVVKNDTAKLIFYPENIENPFIYNKK